MSTTQQPPTVEPGQVWRDNDQRSLGSGEFTVLDVFEETQGRNRGATIALVKRSESGVVRRIRVDRMLAGGPRGYSYIGRQR